MKKIILISSFVIILISIKINGQWVQTNGPFGGDVRCFVQNGSNLYAGTGGNGVFLSTNNGTEWKAANSGMTSTFVNSLVVTPNGTGGTNLFAGVSSLGVSFHR
jgi:hypothetical protein